MSLTEDGLEELRTVLRNASVRTHEGLPDTIGPDEVYEKSRSMESNICRDWEILNTIINNHWHVIQNRWRRKSKAKRRAILLQAWPNMPSSHRPDLEVWRRGHRGTVDIGDPEMAIFMWPHINLEDLAKDEPLLLMAHDESRRKLIRTSRFTPDEKVPTYFPGNPAGKAALLARVFGF
ncbi:hypothetical protein F5X99DRAFT_430778 [Biscogniauxia marginata]|nr:hypothetical protein F5X99DRAFT_430778 [Biscogniauxia marginata]